MMLTILLVFSAIFTGLYLISKWRYSYWKRRNVPYIEPTPILGNYGDYILLKRHLSYVVDDLCKKMPDEPYIGVFIGTEPTLIVKDPELLKLITTKDFYYFNGRQISNYVQKEEFTRNMFSNNGDEWKVIRQNLTPVFTSAKMRSMFHLIAKCSYDLENLLDKEYIISGTIETQKLAARFTMACITSCAFGVDSNTMGEGYNENPFMKVGDSFFGANRVFAFKTISRLVWPRIYYGLGLKASPPGVCEFFQKLTSSIFEARDYKPTSRNDFIDFILNFKQKNYIVGDSITNLKTGENKKVKLPVTDELLSTQSLLFFMAGFETSATATSYTLYLLAQHSTVQKNVQDEIDDYLDKYENKLTYDIVTELPYTYACIEEALRLFPVLVNITREVMEDYTLPSGMHLMKGVRIHIPVYHMHRDPKFFTEPEEYRPERFLGEERQNIVPFSYMPFGEGSRICIGMRFAKMQMLAGLVTLFKKYSIELDESTPKKLEFQPQAAVPTPMQPLKIKIKPREGWESRLFDKA